MWTTGTTHLIKVARSRLAEARKTWRIPQTTFFAVATLFYLEDPSIATAILGYPLLAVFWIDVVFDLLALFKERNFHYGKLGQLILNIAKASIVTIGVVLAFPKLVLIGIALRPIYDLFRCIYHFYNRNDPHTGALHRNEFKQYAVRFLNGLAIVLGAMLVLFPPTGGISALVMVGIAMAIIALNSFHNWQLSPPDARVLPLIVAAIRVAGTLLVSLSLCLKLTFAKTAIIAVFATAAAGPFFPLVLLGVAVVIAIFNWLLRIPRMPVSKLSTDTIALTEFKKLEHGAADVPAYAPTPASTMSWDAYRLPSPAASASAVAKAVDGGEVMTEQKQLDNVRLLMGSWASNLRAKIKRYLPQAEEAMAIKFRLRKMEQGQSSASESGGEKNASQSSCWASTFPGSSLNDHQKELLSALNRCIQTNDFVQQFKNLEAAINDYSKAFRAPTQIMGVAEMCYLEMQALYKKMNLLQELQVWSQMPDDRISKQTSFQDLVKRCQRGEFTNGFESAAGGEIDQMFHQFQMGWGKNARLAPVPV